MRANVARCVLVILTAVVLSGCYSDGRWSAPNLAFWKSSPFQSTPSATPGPVGSPVKPSGIAAASKSNHDDPAGEYRFDRRCHDTIRNPIGNRHRLQYASTGYAQYRLPDGPNIPRPRRTPSAVVSTGPSGYGPTNYTASTAGVPGVSAYRASPTGVAGTNGPYGPTGAAAASSPYSGTNSYASPASSSYANPAGSPYGTTPATPLHRIAPPMPLRGPPAAIRRRALRLMPGTRCAHPPPIRAPTGTAALPPTPVRHTGRAADRAIRPMPARVMEHLLRTFPVRRGPIRWLPPTAMRRRAATRRRWSAAATLRRAPCRRRRAAAAIIRRRPPAIRPRTRADRAGSAPANPSNPASTNPNNTAPDANRYAPPGGFSVPPASGASDPPAYRPGSTSDYVPRRAATSSGWSPPCQLPRRASLRPATRSRPPARECKAHRCRRRLQSPIVRPMR